MSDLCVELRTILVERFSDSELHTLATDLGVEYSDLPGASKTDKARELVYWFERRRKLGLLVAAIEAARPDVELDSGGVVIGCERVRIRRRRAVGMETPARIGMERQVERLADSMDQVRTDISQLRTDVRLLQADMASVNQKVGKLEELVRTGAPMGRQTVVTLIFGVAVIFMAAAVILMAGLR
jgi:hypothetical protein